MLDNKAVMEKWDAVLTHEDLPEIKDNYRKGVVAQLLENTQEALRASGQEAPTSLLEAAPTNNISGGAIDTFDPVLISLVRRAMPNLIAFDVAGVQPMNGPTGLIFAMRSHYTTQTGDEALFGEANTEAASVVGGNSEVFGDSHTGTGPEVTANSELYNFAGSANTLEAEDLGAGITFPEMAFSIDKIQVTAGTRAMKAEYTTELAQDLKAIHGLDAEQELANILSAEILAEINRELIRTINISAKRGAQVDTTTAGVFDLDTDSNGRWSVEKFKGLMFQLEREANAIAKATRRGKGNLMICSSDVASALNMAGVLDVGGSLANSLGADDTGNTFAGVLNGRFKVYIDPYTTVNYATVGYKGSNAFDAGIFYAPYVPLQMVRAIGENTFQPKIGFKTRYGMVANPFHDSSVGGGSALSGAITADSNDYYRAVIINNLM